MKTDNEKARESFIYAQTVLAWLADAGVTLAHVEMFVDGSGKLVVYRAEEMTLQLRKQAEQRLHSTRWRACGAGGISLESCDGWHP